jgi:hypothetical protein
VFFYLFGTFLNVHHRSLQWRQSNYSDATNIGEVPLPKHLTSREIFPLFEKIYDGEPILSDFSIIGEDIKYGCFN